MYNCFKKTLPNVTFQLFFNLKVIQVTYFDLKTAFPKKLRSHRNCKINTYYGETKHHPNVKSGENLSLSALTGNRINNNKKFAVTHA